MTAAELALLAEAEELALAGVLRPIYADDPERRPMQTAYTTIATLRPNGTLDLSLEELEDWTAAALLPPPPSDDSTSLPVFDPVPVRITVERV